ncbi:hypothetical protein CSB07_01715 [Candidatus Gracilibacteria bacterium]|nr:MAG: hypothetical protein CSB07_01715 [Candidatus Gracilibacteria bacterium]PIE85809.1 MAG: hypothetical protein CSA08_00050 [Candidatus Gracilibacteria bacterium]
MNVLQKEMYEVQKNPENAKLTPEEIRASHDTAVATMKLNELMEGITTAEKIASIREEVATNIEDKLGKLFGISPDKMQELHKLDGRET